jgi:Zn-finger nucleic acid-binding protein
MNPMTCPRCQTPLRERERETANRDIVVMDVCPNCGGLWLDRGELEKLSQSESRYYQGDQLQGANRDRRDYDDDDDDDDRFGGRGGQGQGMPGGNRFGGGFLGNLFGNMGND